MEAEKKDLQLKLGPFSLLSLKFVRKLNECMYMYIYIYSIYRDHTAHPSAGITCESTQSLGLFQ